MPWGQGAARRARRAGSKAEARAKGKAAGPRGNATPNLQGCGAYVYEWVVCGMAGG